MSSSITSKFIRISFNGFVISLISGCITFVRRVDLGADLSLEKDEGVIVLPKNFVNRYSQATFVEKNNGTQFKIGFDLPDGMPLSYAVKAGKYCLLSLKYKEDIGYNQRYFLTFQMDGKSDCFDIYPGETTKIYYNQ